MPVSNHINKQIDRLLSANSPSTLMGARSVLHFNGVPTPVVYLVVMMIVASWVPLAFAMRAKFAKSSQPRIHIFLDMDQQAKYKAQAANPLYANNMAMRPPIPGTVARGQLAADDFMYRGYRLTGGNAQDGFEVEFFDGFPQEIEVTADFLARGKELFARNCYVCHGFDGYGSGPVHLRASSNPGKNPKWVQPSNLHDEVRRGRSTGHIYNTINVGIRNMSGYGQVIPAPEDRWAIVAYVKALQMSQNADASLVPQERQSSMPVQPTWLNGKPVAAVIPQDATTQPAEGETEGESASPATGEAGIGQ